MMIFYYKYITPENFDNLILVSDGQVLTNLFFESLSDIKINNFGENNKSDFSTQKKSKGILPIFVQTICWLNLYFYGKQPDFTPAYRTDNLTPFREKVQNHILGISWGKTLSYNDIAKQIAAESGIAKMSAQAVGNAVGWNPICIIIPCHRVISVDRKVTGYSGGIKNKIELLKLEKIKYKTI